MTNDNRVQVSYRLNLSGGSWIELHIDAPATHVSPQDASFILLVMERINQFAEIVTHGSAPAEIPAVIRGLTRNEHIETGPGRA